jgi:hypothetical protein
VLQNSDLAPIALFVYNRLEHTRRTVEALCANELASDSDLFVYADAAKNDAATESVARVREYVRRVTGFKSVTVIERESNWGVDPSVIDGVTTLSRRFGKVIVLEDDMVTSPYFLNYMNSALVRYRENAQVMQISGFMFPIDSAEPGSTCFLKYATCWGWATWDRAWQHFEKIPTRGYALLTSDRVRRRVFNLSESYDYYGLLTQYVEGKTDAWDIRWYLSIFLRDGLTLFPQQSLIHNIGFDGTGVHCAPSDFAGKALSERPITNFVTAEENQVFRRLVETYLMSKRESKSARLAAQIRHRLKSTLRMLLPQVT